MEKQNTLHASITAANRSGRLGLVVYAIAGYPDAEQSGMIQRVIAESDVVSGVETRALASIDVGTHKSAALAHALEGAPKTLDLNAYNPGKPIILIVYPRFEESIVDMLESLLPHVSGAVDAVTLEGLAPEPAVLDVVRQSGLGFIPGIQFDNDDDLLETKLAQAHGGVVYLASAMAAGGTLISSVKLATVAARVKAIRSDIKIVAGLGIRTPEHVACFAAINGVDAVVIGSAFLTAMRDGATGVQTFLRQIEPALYFRRHNHE